MQIGNYTIYDNQIKAGNDFFEALINKKTPVLCSQPQMGKTGTFVYVVSKILEYCKLNDIENFRIYHSINISDNTVKDQTIKDYKEAFKPAGWGGFGAREALDYINVIHHADLKKINIDKNTTYFFLSDESHIAINKLGQIHKLDDQIKNNEILYYKGYCSATPFTFDTLRGLLQSSQKDNFVPIILKPSVIYYGIENYNKEGRIKESYSLFDKDTDGNYSFTYNSSHIINDFADKVKKFGNGFFIIRDTKKVFNNEECKESLKEYIKFNHQIDCDISQFDSAKSNIDKLEERLELGPSKNKSEIIIIKGTLRLGKRLHKQYIRCCLDTPSKSASNAASVIQALLGRCCGNDVYNNPNDNSDDKFNIYCNTKEINTYIEWWHKIQNHINPLSIPSSGYSKSNVKTEKSNCQILVFNDYDAAYQELQTYKTHSWFKEDHARKWQSLVSSNNEINICKKIIEVNKPSDKSLIYFVDAPNVNYQDDWNNLEAYYKNKWILFLPTNSHTISQTITAPTPSLLSKKIIPTENLL